MYARICEKCGSKTYTETEYPLDVPVVCNVCTARMTAPLEDDPNTQLLFDMPNDLKARLIDMAQKHRVPIDVVLKDFIQWKMGRPTKTTFSDQTEKKSEK